MAAIVNGDFGILVAFRKRFTPKQLKKRGIGRLSSLLISPLISLTLLLGTIYPLTTNVDKLLRYSHTI